MAPFLHGVSDSAANWNAFAEHHKKQDDLQQLANQQRIARLNKAPSPQKRAAANWTNFAEDKKKEDDIKQRAIQDSMARLSLAKPASPSAKSSNNSAEPDKKEDEQLAKVSGSADGDALKRAATNWSDFAECNKKVDDLEQLHMQQCVARMSIADRAYAPITPVRRDNAHKVGADGARKLAEEEFLGDFPAHPMNYFRGDGKLFHLKYDPVIANTVEDGWDDDEIEIGEGRFARPTYTCAPGKVRNEVNYARWKLTEAPEEDLDSPSNEDEWLLNNYDFNQPTQSRPVIDPLNNYIDLPLKKLYPKGMQILVNMSKRSGSEWKPGQPLGADPNNKLHRTMPLGWIPPQFRNRKRGLGADITDPVYKYWFFGDLNKPLPDGFVEPNATWRNPGRVLVMKSSVTQTNPTSHEMSIISFPALMRKHRVGTKNRSTPMRTALREKQHTAAVPRERIHMVGEVAGSKRPCADNPPPKTTMTARQGGC
ncbi:hypothetical protein GGR52DRAFT_577399 [Hypoxylon sp. FL1284]|nr:hypothetical protein GGR52DRAFT_577399 [Hypoxylon sp. FL1284]